MFFGSHAMRWFIASMGSASEACYVLVHRVRRREELARRLAPQDKAPAIGGRDAIRRVGLAALELLDVLDLELQVRLERAQIDAVALLDGLGADKLLEHIPREAYLRSG